MRSRHAVAAAMLLVAATPVAAATATIFGYEFELVGSASVVDSQLQLTPPAGDNAGAAWLTTRVPLGGSFLATFSYSLARGTFDPMADGISFAIQPESPVLVGTGGGGIGYNDLGAVGWVLQSWDNNRLGLNTDGDAFSAAAAPADLGAAALVTGTQQVLYDAANSVLSMSGTINADGNVYTVSESVSIDLSSVYGAPLYIGFTGGTGLSHADQRITAFAVTAAIPEPGEWALMLAGLGVIGAITRLRARRAAGA